MSRSVADIIREFRRVLNANEVEELTDIDVKTLYRMVHQDRIPGFKVGRKVCFDCFKLADWYEAQAGA